MPLHGMGNNSGPCYGPEALHRHASELLLLVTVIAVPLWHSSPAAYRTLLFSMRHSTAVTADASECLGTQRSHDDKDTWDELPTSEA